MSGRRLLVRGRRVVLAGGEHAASILIEDGRISAISDYDSPPPADETIEAGELAVLPGLVDSHVHVNEPGRTEWEGFETATRAAAAGGITTIVDMPLNCLPVTTTRAALRVKREAVGGLLSVDCAFWGGVIPGNTAELAPLIDDGVAGFKAFLVHSGIDEFPNASEDDLRRALPILAARQRPLIVHAECDTRPPATESGDPGRYATYLASRPAAWENEAIDLLIRLCRDSGAHIHVVHLSSAEALPAIAAARQEGLPFTVETCPHYLYFAAEEIPDRQTPYKCAPPIRERANRERLWRGLGEGTIDLVVSDHSPCTPHLKRLDAGDFMAAWGGISSLQLALSVVWTAAQERDASLHDLATWMSARPAKLAGLYGRKGAIALGFDADLVLFDDQATFTVEPQRLHHKHKLTPYAGRSLTGVVKTTLLRGERIFDDGAACGPRRGELIARKDLR